MNDASERAQRFMQALQDCERNCQAKVLTPLFSDDAQLSKLAKPASYNGSDGAETFWGEYLAAFSDIRSKFVRVCESDETTFLEWQAEGHLPNGNPIHYGGVSILEWEGDRVKSFRTYYDSAAFVATAAAAESAP